MFEFPSKYQEFIYTRTYSRWDEEQQRRELWPETVGRYADFFNKRVPDDKKEEFNEAISSVIKLEVMPSMRALWTAGPALERENIAGYNCSYLAVNTVKSFAECLYILMNGTGVGFSVERQEIAKLPEVPALKETDYVVEFADSKKGWADGFYRFMRCLYKGELPKYDLSKIRPKGSILKTFGGRASGPEPLEDLIKFTTAVFKSAQGRKLSSIECHDIMCKIAAIVVVGGTRRSACISLSNRSDDRMAHAKDGEFWNTNPQRMLANNSIVYTEKPDATQFMEDWLNLARSGSGERGIFNREASKFIIDNIGRRDSNYSMGCNPCCFTGDMRLLTKDGYKTFEELSGTSVSIVNSNGNLTDGAVWEVGEKDIVEVCFSLDRPNITCTYDHVFMLNDGTECQAQNLQGKRIMPYIEMATVGENKEAILAGYMIGDANLKRIDSDAHKGIEVFFGKNDYDVAELFNQEVGTWYSREAMDIALKYGLKSKYTYENELPENVSSDMLQGIFSANGCVNANSRVCYKTTSKKLVNQLADILDREYNISSYITTNKPTKVKHHNGEYTGRESYDLNIARYTDIIKFAKYIGFVQKYKMDRLLHLLVSKAPYVRNVKKAGTSIVYDFTEPETHWGIVEGCIVHNSEIILRPNQFCNLTEVVVTPSDTKQSLREKVKKATILGCLQSTLTDFGFLSRSWKTNTEEERLLGVSLTGIRDHIILGKTSKKAKAWLTELKETAIETAEEWSDALGINMPTAITCTKPSGTVSQLVDSASGLHPRYAPYYIRRVRVSTSDPMYKYLDSIGVKWEPEVGQERATCSTAVFAFPVASPESSIMREDVDAMEQLEHWLMIQKYWCEHKPSITVYVRDNEWLKVGSWVYEHWNYVSGISFLPYDGGVYPLAPYEECTKEEYEKMVSEMPDIDFSNLSAFETEDRTEGSREFNCTGDKCEL